MSSRLDELPLDVLYNIENAIVTVFGDEPELTDYQVEKSLAALIRFYQARGAGQPAPSLTLRPVEQAVFDAVRAVCEWEMGDAEMMRLQQGEAPTPPQPYSLDLILVCLKRLRKSVTFWTKQSGRQGYLNYVSSFIRSGGGAQPAP